MNPRNEPLLWLQLVALGAIPLELLLLLLVLAGADPGPLPALERALAWGLGVLGPSLLLWRRPADCGSLLLVQVPAEGRSPLLTHLNALQQGWPPRILLPFGSALLLAALWIVDSRAALAASLSPVDGASRLVTLMLAMPLLALLLWQWQQLGQALWLLSRSPQQVELASSGEAPLVKSKLLSLGIPLLLLAPLDGQDRCQGQDGRGSLEEPSEESGLQSTAPESTAPESSAPEPSVITVPETATPTTEVAVAVAVEPEQTGEQDKGDELDQQVD
ncbi:MAG: low-complexity tail membrane protein [Cyanobium sp. M30B3]|nr:MAG: low-complexity tail membrane protein [Cyanobium sp. M30B3]